MILIQVFQELQHLFLPAEFSLFASQTGHAHSSIIWSKLNVNLRNLNLMKRDYFLNFHCSNPYFFVERMGVIILTSFLESLKLSTFVKPKMNP